MRIRTGAYAYVPAAVGGFSEDHTSMKDILRTTDPVLLSFAESMLTAAGIPVAVFDVHTSAVEGSILAIPRRLMVADEDVVRAEAIIEAAVASRA